MHLEIEMVDAMSARFCSQFIVSLFGGELQHGKFGIEERWSSKPKKQSEEEKKEASRSPKITKKAKEAIWKQDWEMWIIFLQLIFSHPRRHRPETKDN